ncbi:MAG TPA: histidine-type phosphatase [Caulobacteraceae bacterium]|nr:histidine-type phosphatase [Caulobacteraceae bacterium]
MLRPSVLVLALALSALVGGIADAAPMLERVVVVMRHGVRPPTQSNDQLRKYSADPWPAWPVAPGDLTPHGGRTVALTGRTIRATYVGAGLLPARGCAGPGAVSVWADGADERTQMTGVVLAAALSGGCDAPVGWSLEKPRDQIFGSASGDACKVDASHEWSRVQTPQEIEALKAATAKLQAIVAPTACDPTPGPGTCFTRSPDNNGIFPNTASLAEDILLEYAEGMRTGDVGWGRASETDIDLILQIHEAAFGRLRDNVYASARRGAAMTRVIMAGLQGEPIGGGPETGPNLKLLGLAGHDTNLVLMASTFGLTWKLPDNPDATAPSTALAFELWRDGGRRYVRAVLISQTLDQLRSQSPGVGQVTPLKFEGCASGPMASCPLEQIKRRIEKVIPPDCGWPTGGPVPTRP